MVKEFLNKIVKKDEFVPRALPVFLSGVLLLVSGCASTASSSTFEPKITDISAEIRNSKTPPLWSKTMRGAISGLSLSKNGQAILVATSPDPDLPGSASTFLLSWLDPRGHLIWQNKVSSPIKDQDLSPDGKFAVVTNYSDQVMAYNAKGRVLWTQKGTCRPYVLPLTHKTLCYHDDDPDSDIAFDIFDTRGKKLLSYPISTDILSLKFSPDERYFVLGLEGGHVVLLDSEFRTLWERKVEGEVVDVSVSSGNRPLVSVLYRNFSQARGEQTSQSTVALLDLQGNSLGKLALETQAIQLEFSAQGTHLYMYGNEKSEQHLQVLDLPLPGELTRRRWSTASDYSIPISVAGEGVFMGVENSNSRQSHLLYFESSGRLVHDWVIPGSEWAFLYLYRFSLPSKLVVVAADDGKLAAFRLN